MEFCYIVIEQVQKNSLLKEEGFFLLIFQL